MDFRQGLTNSALIKEWNDMTAEEQKKYDGKSGIFSPFGHFVSCKVSREKHERRSRGKLTY